MHRGCGCGRSGRGGVMSSELHHLGLNADTVPTAAVLVDDRVAAATCILTIPGTDTERREYRSGRLATNPDVLVCTGAFGAPAATIALEELARAGVRAAVAVSACLCSACEDRSASAHGVFIPFGAVRQEGVSAAYAPPEFPAVPDPQLARALRDLLPGCGSGIVRTVDVPPLYHPSPPAPEISELVDLQSGALMVVAAAKRISFAAMVLGAQALLDAGDRGILHQLEAAARAAATDRGGAP